jgi:FkbM family methyltransferase
LSIKRGEILRAILRRSVVSRSRAHIRGVREAGSFLSIDIAGLDHPLYWPKTLPIKDLFSITEEILDPNDWHRYEIPETSVRNGDVVVDCGASEGLFALTVMDRASRVYAFEPSELFIAAMQRTFAGTNVILERTLLGARTGTVGFVDESLRSRADVDSTLQRPVVTLDAWSERTGSRIDYIKADVEGSELDLIEGGLSVIERNRPRIAIAVYHQPHDWQTIISRLRQVVPEYNFRTKGVVYGKGSRRPTLLHAWAPSDRA